MSTFTTAAVSEAGKAVALAVVLSVVVAYVPLLALLRDPGVCRCLLAYLTLRRGVGVGLAATVCVAALAAAVTGLGNGLMALLVAGLLGVILGVALHARRGFSWTLGVTTLGATERAGGVDGVGVDLDRDESSPSSRSWWTTLWRRPGSSKRRMGMSQESVDLASQQIHETLRMIPYLLRPSRG